MGDVLALARVISFVENKENGYRDLLSRVFPQSGRAYRIGITGPPGVGKSTLVDRLSLWCVENKSTVGVIAVDPSSPFTGGALLGDRIRMNNLPLGKGVFIRSMATRGSTGGLASATKDVSLVLDAFGKDYILIETVGVGQIELDIVDACDTTVVVLVPESGDAIQAMKAGLMEIADLIVVNKADRDGADRFIQELQSILELRNDRHGWRIPVVSTQAVHNTGIDSLVQSLDAHRQFLKDSHLLEAKRKRQIQQDLINLVNGKVKEHLSVRTLRDAKLDAITEDIFNRVADPYSAADTLFRDIIASDNSS